MEKMELEEALRQVWESLELTGEEVNVIGRQRYFKEEIKSYGVALPIANRIARESFARIKHHPKSQIFDACEQLWSTGYFEEAIIACHWSERLHKSYKPQDLELFESWVNQYVHNWATCDTFCNHSVGSLMEQYPELVSRLKIWAVSDNRWLRRAAAVSLIVPAKKGLFIDDILEIAEILLRDKDDLVQKGYGWLLKVASIPHLQLVFDFVIEHKQDMPRTALRYAVEKMPLDFRSLAMAK